MEDYRFDKEKLRFTANRKGFKYYLKKVLKYFVLSVLLAIVYYFVFSIFFDTSSQRSLRRENEKMKEEYERISGRLSSLDTIMGELDERDRDIYGGMFSSIPFSLDNIEYPGLRLHMSGEGDSTDLMAAYSEMELMGRNVSNRLDSLNSILENMDSLEYIPSIPPLAGFHPSQASASVGMKINPFYKRTVRHDGMDMVAAEGTEVLAPADGKVLSVQRAYKEDGNVVMIKHARGYVTRYAHLGDILVRKGSSVRRGEVIARSGNSGVSFAPHLHYEILLNGEPVDPVHYFFQNITPDEYVETLLYSVNSYQSFD